MSNLRERGFRRGRRGEWEVGRRAKIKIDLTSDSWGGGERIVKTKQTLYTLWWSWGGEVVAEDSFQKKKKKGKKFKKKNALRTRSPERGEEKRSPSRRPLLPQLARGGSRGEGHKVHPGCHRLRSPPLTPGTAARGRPPRLPSPRPRRPPPQLRVDGSKPTF